MVMKITGADTPSPTTTVPSTKPTIPGSDTPGGSGGSDILSGFDIGAPAGGIKVDWSPPLASNFGDPNTPYQWKNNDWQVLNTMDSKTILQVQTLLQKAFPGFSPGVAGSRYDSKTVSKLKDAIVTFNALQQDANNTGIRGKNLMQSLEYLAANPVLDGTSGGAGRTISLRDPNTLKKAFEGGAQSALGRTLSPEDMDKLLKSFNQLDTNYQRAASGGGIVVQPPDAGVFAETQAEKLAPVEAEANDYMNYMGALSDWMQG
jgi:hypothetical protein